MEKILECIPNFSEGRNKKIIEAIIENIIYVPRIFLLDQESDPAHNRSVITFAGEPEAVMEAAFQACKKASELIDLDKHQGEHPRMGATDVIPFVPIKGISEKEAIEMANKLAKRIATELKIPIYLYEKCATRPEHKNLAHIRRGEYKTIKKEIAKNPERAPDYGPKIVGKAGATAIGVRPALIAYNVNLATKDLKIAKGIARKIREKNGGLPGVKALGFELANRGIVQVSMNLTDYKQTAPHEAFKAVKKEAKKYGVKVLESEIIGLIPEEALLEAGKSYLKLRNFKNEQILENVLHEKIGESVIPSSTVMPTKMHSLKCISSNQLRNYSNFTRAKCPICTTPTHPPTLLSFLDQVSSKSPTPGGGSVSALIGALAAALCSMVANLTLNNKKYFKTTKIIQKTLEETEKIRQKLYELIEKDAAAYNKVSNAFKTKNTATIQNALKAAAETPLEIAKTATQLTKPLKALTQKGNKNASSDRNVGKLLMEAAIKGAILNIKINLKYIKDKKYVAKMLKKIKKLRT